MDEQFLAASQLSWFSIVAYVVTIVCISHHGVAILQKLPPYIVHGQLITTVRYEEHRYQCLHYENRASSFVDVVSRHVPQSRQGKPRKTKENSNTLLSQLINLNSGVKKSCISNMDLRYPILQGFCRLVFVSGYSPPTCKTSAPLQCGR